MFGKTDNLWEEVQKLEDKIKRLNDQLVKLDDRVRLHYARRETVGDLLKRTNIDIDGHDIPVNNLVVALINYLNLDVVEIKHAYVLEERDAK